ncbi:hypothetical protein [Streptomyces sp. NPDC049881]|uniref:hypothetical protein n=1 Tax=unclassified Streptomyces TaxID=2593676 RepID=UPI003414B845
MSPSPAGAAPDDGRYDAVCAHTHLFNGARVRVQGLADPGRATGLTLRFSDGATADAELLVAGTGDASLAVGEYVTRAGTTLSRRVWQVRELTPEADGTGLRLGPRAD